MKTSSHFEYKIVNKHDFNYVSVFFSLPEIVVGCEYHDPYEYEDHKNYKFIVKFPTEIIYKTTAYEDGEIYFRIFWIKILGFGFGIKKQTGY
jgi:hypothetical protein